MNPSRGRPSRSRPTAGAALFPGGVSGTPTERSLRVCRHRRWHCQKVEYWQPFHGRVGGVRRDLFGCIDIVALDGQPGLLGIQACSASSVSSRVKKAQNVPAIRAWIAAGNRFEVWGWTKGRRIPRVMQFSVAVRPAEPPSGDREDRDPDQVESELPESASA